MAGRGFRPAHNPRLGIAFICLGMMAITVNDSILKQFSDRYPLHEIVFVRAAVAMLFSLAVLRFEGGLRALRTRRPGAHIARALCMVVANMSFFGALAAIPLADATALFFVAPLFITLLSIPFLGERVGIRRFSAVAVGFVGVLVVLRPAGEFGQAVDRLILLLPVVAALAYAAMQILTRRLRASAPASAMAVYIQGTLIAVSIGFFVAAGDGRYAAGLESKSALFLLRAWTWPTPEHWLWFVLLGGLSAFIAYAVTQAYRLSDAATLAPFEYIALPMAIALGWLVFDHLPDVWVLLGCALIAGSGVYVYRRKKNLADADVGVSRRRRRRKR
ncbi:MAG: DMT family transporter [Immundisolibacterales bacterium]|nr:DMT family transporter [Immundisolibacterales bacterium]